MSVHSKILKLIASGPVERCARTGVWRPRSEMNPDGKGGWIRKEYDCFVRDNETSKIKPGPGKFRYI